jgi:hypothetical protein
MAEQQIWPTEGGACVSYNVLIKKLIIKSKQSKIPFMILELTKKLM